MSITLQDVKKIAKLSRIKLSEQEVEHFQKELAGIFKWVEMLQDVNTDNVPQMASVANAALPWREDKVTDGNIQGDVLANAPRTDFGCFIVPKVVE